MAGRGKRKAARDARRTGGVAALAGVFAPRFAPFTAAGWLALAGVILAWPRQRSLSDRAKEGGEAVLHKLSGRMGWWASPNDAPALAEAREPGHGRGATSPAAIPPAGWRDIFARTWSEFNMDRIPAVAGGVAFFALLAVFPAMAAFVSLYGLFSDVATAEKQLSMLSGILPRDTLDFVGQEMLRFASRSHGQLSLAFVTSLLISIWSANGAIKALFDGLNVAYEEREKRNILQLNLISLAFTLGGLLFVIFALSAVIATPNLLAYVGYSQGRIWLGWLRWPIMLVGSIAALSIVYRYGPSRQHARWRWISGGGVVAAVFWLGASMLFSWYVGNFAHYDRTYGSLGAVVGFMTWIWLSTTIVLVGAELNAEIEHQTAVDTTTGHPVGMGGRGARMADTLGKVGGEAGHPTQAERHEEERRRVRRSEDAAKA